MQSLHLRLSQLIQTIASRIMRRCPAPYQAAQLRKVEGVHTRQRLLLLQPLSMSSSPGESTPPHGRTSQLLKSSLLAGEKGAEKHNRQGAWVAISHSLLFFSREQRKIAALCRDEAHKQTMQKSLVEKETHMLRKIEAAKRKIEAGKTQRRLKMEWSEEGRPLNWNGIPVDTPQICRIRALNALYGELAADVDKITARIGLLERTRTVLEGDPSYGNDGLAKDVISLVSREVCLLQFRDTDLGADALAGLRCRLLHNFARMLTAHASSCRRDRSDSSHTKLLA